QAEEVCSPLLFGCVQGWNGNLEGTTDRLIAEDERGLVAEHRDGTDGFDLDEVRENGSQILAEKDVLVTSLKAIDLRREFDGLVRPLPFTAIPFDGNAGSGHSKK